MALIVSHEFAEFIPALAMLTGLISASRPILGLHYPSDVIAGAAIGTSIATIVLALPF